MKSYPFMQQRGRRWWIIPKPFDLVSSILYLAVIGTFFTYHICACEPLASRIVRSTALVCCVVALLFIDRWEYWRYGEEPSPGSACMLLVIRILLIEAVAQLDHFNFSPFLYLIPPFLACLYFGNQVGFSLAALAWIVYISKLWLHSSNWYASDHTTNNLIVFTLGLIFAIMMARIVVNERASRKRTEHLLAELEDSHLQLKTYTAQVEELATTKERNRLARDIHDTLGHYLTVINVQLEKALVFRDKKPHEADQAVSDAKRLASEALQDVRRSVGILRATSEIFSFSTAITRLVEHMQSEQLNVNTRIDGSDSDFSAQILIALYRAAQEGLTNVQKHAHARQVTLHIQFNKQEATLTLSDDGQGFESGYALSGENYGGFGLQGMQERLELLGGYMEITSRPGQGTCLFVVVPGHPPGPGKTAIAVTQEA
jgi:signal transduction histidine kinase